MRDVMNKRPLTGKIPYERGSYGAQVARATLRCNLDTSPVKNCKDKDGRRSKPK